MTFRAGCRAAAEPAPTPKATRGPSVAPGGRTSHPTVGGLS